MEIEKKFDKLGPYNLVKKLGEGASSDIFLGKDPINNVIRALKVLKSKYV